MKCKCGSAEFEAMMVTKTTVRVSTESGYPEYIQGTEGEKNTDFTDIFICVACKTGYSDITDVKIDETPGTKRCACGNTRFSASQECYHDIIVDADNNYIRDVVIGESENPYGPYTCTNCDAVYEDLNELNKNEQEY